MMNSVKVSAYTQHSVKQKNVNAAQAGSFKNVNGSGVLGFFPGHNTSTNDTVEISNDAKEGFIKSFLDPEDEKTTESKDLMAEWKEKLEKMRSEMNWLRDEIRRAGEIAEGMGEAMRVMIKCLRIAMRIMSGHNVPDADHRFLMENDSSLYSKAVMMKIQKIDPEDLERLSEDEEENAEGSDGIDAASITAPDSASEAASEASTSNVDAGTAVDIEV